MDAWTLIDERAVPDGGTMTLVARGNLFSIRVNDLELMSNREHGSEDALADLAFDRLDSPRDAHVLIGGLGMGFTLAAALRRLGPTGKASVAELIPAVVDWNREHTGATSGHPLRDPRTEVLLGDICDRIETPPVRWDAILLDIDNSPAAFTRQSNGWLYTKQGLHALKSALTERGILGVWSSAASPAFTRRLRKSGFSTEVIPYIEPGCVPGDGLGTHYLWMARPR